jgi:hypothetical protein
MEEEVERMAAEAVELAAGLNLVFDYSEASVPAVEQAVAQLAEYATSLAAPAIDLTVQRFGCYLLEVGRRTYGGRLLWNEERAQPVLVVGEPQCRIAVMTWDKVRGRLAGDTADELSFFWAGFATRAKVKKAGTDVLVT